MKQIIFIFVSLVVFFAGHTAFADDNNHGGSVADVLLEIMNAQGVSVVSDISCDTVSDDQFEALGDGVMGLMHPDPELHAQMDAMMGGEGSETLRTAHIHMGEGYLGCGTGSGMPGGMGMMGSGMMSMMGGILGNNLLNMKGGETTMMNSLGSLGGLSFAWIGMVLFWAIVSIGIISLILWLVRFNQDRTHSASALDILKNRYANGEINTKQFEEIKKNINSSK